MELVIAGACVFALHKFKSVSSSVDGLCNVTKVDHTLNDCPDASEIESMGLEAFHGSKDRSIDLKRGQEDAILDHMGTTANPYFEKAAVEVPHPSKGSSEVRDFDKNAQWEDQRNTSMHSIGSQDLAKRNMHPTNAEHVSPMANGFHYGAIRVNPLGQNSMTKNTLPGGVGAPRSLVQSAIGQGDGLNMLTSAPDTTEQPGAVTNAKYTTNMGSKRPNINDSHFKSDESMHYVGPGQQYIGKANELILPQVHNGGETQQQHLTSYSQMRETTQHAPMQGRIGNIQNQTLQTAAQHNIEKTIVMPMQSRETATNNENLAKVSSSQHQPSITPNNFTSLKQSFVNPTSDGVPDLPSSVPMVNAHQYQSFKGDDALTQRGVNITDYVVPSGGQGITNSANAKINMSSELNALTVNRFQPTESRELMNAKGDGAPKPMSYASILESEGYSNDLSQDSMDHYVAGPQNVNRQRPLSMEPRLETSDMKELNSHYASQPNTLQHAMNKEFDFEKRDDMDRIAMDRMTGALSSLEGNEFVKSIHMLE